MKNTIILFIAGFTWSLSACIKCDEPVSACSLTPDSGPCEAYIPKYYYDQEAGECKEFIWGGCDGVVPFDSMEECKECVAKN